MCTRIAFLLFSCALAAQTPSIQFDPARKVWLLTTRANSYALGVDNNGAVQNLYWGGPLWRLADVPQARSRRDLSSFDPRAMLETEEYPGWGGPRFDEPSVKVAREDGDRDLVLRYVSHLIKDDELLIELKDIKDDIQVFLHYRLWPAYGVLRRHASIVNRTNKTLMVESAQSGAWYPPAGEGYRLTYLTGRWAAETQIAREPVHTGVKVLESRRGNTSHNLNPWFALDRGSSTETSGPVWTGALAWSGNWRIAVEQTPYAQVRVTGGYNTFDFAYPLKPFESLDTPHFYGAYTDGGFGEASRLLHRFTRETILPGGASARLRPVLYNSWEATTFDVTEAGQKSLADKAAKLGIELFVVDDGWFGKRNNDRAGLGDWFVNPAKFPQGLNPLIEHVNKLGMDFGLWVEPEMINADSDLYRAHPDWVIHFPNRPRSELRNQMVLNLARNDVKEHLYSVLNKLATDHKIRYFKWDMNRSLSEPGWPQLPAAEQRKLWVDYVRNLYEIIDRLRVRHPQLEIEACSGGGGRIDLGILARVDEVWTSDNTEAFDRLRIQEGFSLAYPAKVMSAWVTDVPNMNGRSVSLQYRFLSSMQAALGVGANLTKWTDADNELAARMIAVYKRIRATVQTGNLYRLQSAYEGDITANQYVSADGRQSAVFVFRHAQQYRAEAPPVALQGLDEKAVYRVEAVTRNLREPAQEMSGAALMRRGLSFNLRGDYDSAAVILERIGK